MEKYVDLHIHTTASDGTLTPRQAVELARSLGLAAVAITDHDTTSGLGEAARAGAELGVEVVPGLELSAGYRDKNVHILGYFIDPDAPALRAALDWFVRERKSRNERIVAALAADGFHISMGELEAAWPATVLGRPHIAEALVRRGYAAGIDEAFDRFLNRGRPYYRPRRRMPMDRAVAAVLASGGIACVAHPLQYGFPPDELEAFLRAAKTAGCAALEAYYSKYSQAQQAALRAMAARLGLAVSGGSDFHGDRKPDIQMGSGVDGSLRVPYGLLEVLRTAARRGDG